MGSFKIRKIAVLAAVIALLAAIAVTSQKKSAPKSIEEYVFERTGKSIPEVEEELDLWTTDYDYSDDIHDAGEANYEDLEINEPEDSDLPRIDITLDPGYTLTNEYQSCSISLSGAGSYNFDHQAAEIRIRGNWTSSFDKKPFKIKFGREMGFFGRDPERSWTLLANYTDPTAGLHNYLSYDLYDYLTDDTQFVPLYEFTDLYINGVYIGLYALSDQIETGKGRININGRHGRTLDYTDYIIEQDYRLRAQESEGENLYWFWSRYNDITYSVKSPDTDVTAEDLDYLRDYIDRVYLAAKLMDYDEIDRLIDVDSFITYFLVKDITRDGDIMKASNYYLKKAGGKLCIATIWDCDLTFGSGGSWYPNGSNARENYLFDALMDVPEFRDRYLDYYFENKEDIMQHVYETIDAAYEAYGPSLSNDYYNWEIENTQTMIEEMAGLEDYNDEIGRIKWWFDAQMAMLTSDYESYR